MNKTRSALIGVAVFLLVVPALALAGTRPPEGAEYAVPGTTTFAVTHEDNDANDVAEKVDLAIGIYKCGNSVPFQLDGVKIKPNGKFKYKGKAKNLAGQKAKLVVKGVFKNANKAVEKVTIKSGGCKAKQKFVLVRQ